jgi:hypothetical protein
LDTQEFNIGRIAEIDMTWLLFSLGLLRCAFVARNGQPAAVHRLNGYDFAVFGPPMMASFKKKLFKFCPKLDQNKTSHYLSLFCRVRAFLIIYITQ